MQELIGDRRGALMAELAAVLPVLTVLLLAGVEVSRYALLNQKLDRVATTIGDLAAQAKTLTVAELDSLLAAARHVAKPFDLDSQGVVIVTSVGALNGTPEVNWQRAGAGSHVATSAIGTPGNDANLPEGLQVDPGETVIVAEVFYSFAPFLFDSLIPETEIYHRAFFRPRVGSLAELSP